MTLMKRLTERAKKRPVKIALPEAEDPRVLDAAHLLYTEKTARPVLVGDPNRIAAKAAEEDIDISGIPVVDPQEHTKKYAAVYHRSRGGDAVSRTIAARVVRRPMLCAAVMLRCGDADAMVAGAATTTANVIRAGSLSVGTAPGVTCPSSFIVMVLPGNEEEKEKILVYADPGFVVAPSAQELAEIALLSAQSAASLLADEPRVAMLSFSTKGSASHENVDKVTKALSIVRQKNPALKVDGELQGDAALMQDVADRKAPGSAVAGKANVLVFPDLNAANIGYKLTRCLAGARAYGPVFQGFNKPFSDLSRGVSTREIADICTIVSLL